MACTWPRAAFAHAESGAAGGFASGFLHPLAGVDHVLAMLAVGMWGAQLGAPAIWLLPVAFPLVMSLGGVAGILGLPMLPIEPGIALSVIVLGACIALAQRPPLWLAGALVSAFAVFHGYAHGTELPAQAGAVAYSAGFVLATGLIHVAGIAIGLVTRLPRGMAALRAAGAAIALAGVAIAWRLL
ncbi:MAG: Ni/Fe hydrogenase [Proteobacteria bacterium]|nr:MAG: Ni/Fe hydrogenase [Pseudomonadota bacterium]